MHTDDEGIGYISKHNNASPTFGYEVAFATTDREGLLKYSTTALKPRRTKSWELLCAIKQSIFCSRNSLLLSHIVAWFGVSVF